MSLFHKQNNFIGRIISALAVWLVLRSKRNINVRDIIS